MTTTTTYYDIGDRLLIACRRRTADISSQIEWGHPSMLPTAWKVMVFQELANNSLPVTGNFTMICGRAALETRTAVFRMDEPTAITSDNE